MGIRIQYTLLGGAEKAVALKCRALGLTEYVDNVLINTWGRQGEEWNYSLQSWNLGQHPWITFHGPGDQVERYQRTLGTRIKTVRGHVRVIRAVKEKKSTISSASICVLSRMRTDEELADCECLNTIALSWDILRDDETWK